MVGVRRPRVAVDAAVLAPLVGIDRLRERDVGRLVARDDRARALDRHRRADWRGGASSAGRRAGCDQPSSYGLAAVAAVAVAGVEGRAAAALGRRAGARRRSGIGRRCGAPSTSESLRFHAGDSTPGLLESALRAPDDQAQDAPVRHAVAARGRARPIPRPARARRRSTRPRRSCSPTATTPPRCSTWSARGTSTRASPIRRARCSRSASPRSKAASARSPPRAGRRRCTSPSSR